MLRSVPRTTGPAPRADMHAVAPSWRTASDLASRFAQSGGVVTGDQLAELLRGALSAGDGAASAAAVGQPISVVARWIVSRGALAFACPQGWLLPMFQFDLARTSPSILRPGVAAVLAELDDVYEGVELALWFVTPNNWLSGAQPAHILRSNPEAVLQAARADRYVACGD